MEWGLAILGLKIKGVSKFAGFRGDLLVCPGLNFPGEGDWISKKEKIVKKRGPRFSKLNNFFNAYLF